MPLRRTADLDGRGLLFVPSAFTWPRPVGVGRGAVAAVRRLPRARRRRRCGSRAAPRRRRRSPRCSARAARRARRARRAALDHRAGARARALPRQRLPALSVLRDAGLVHGHRVGRSVLYVRSAKGEALVGLTIGRYLPILPRDAATQAWNLAAAGDGDPPDGAVAAPGTPFHGFGLAHDDAGAERVARADRPRDPVQGAGPARGPRPAHLRLGGRRRGRGPPAPAALRADRRGSARGDAPSGRTSVLRASHRSPHDAGAHGRGWSRRGCGSTPGDQPPAVAQRRSEEIDADLHDHIAHERAPAPATGASR